MIEPNKRSAETAIGINSMTGIKGAGTVDEIPTADRVAPDDDERGLPIP